MRMNKIVEFIGSVKHIAVLIFLLGFANSLMYTFLIYPRIADTFNVVLDSDGYGALGRGLVHNGALSYYPDNEPTVNRGPLYPAFIALLLYLSPSNASGFEIVQLAQCILNGLITLYVYLISKRLWNSNIAAITACISAFHPIIIWYSSRIWVETLSTFLFTVLSFTLLLLCEKPTKVRAAFCGSVLGITVLCKQTFLPFLFVIPIVMIVYHSTKFKFQHIFIIVCMTLLIVAPWSYRNYLLSGEVIPVHLLAGFNLQMGDSFARNFCLAPFSYNKLMDMGKRQIDSEDNDGILEGGTGIEREVQMDSVYLKRSIKNYLNQPLFLFKKCLINSITFWYLGPTELKSGVIGALQIPLLTLCIFSGFKIVRHGKGNQSKRMLIVLILVYVSLHLPIFSIARFSVPVIPLMLSLGAGCFYSKRRNHLVGEIDLLDQDEPIGMSQSASSLIDKRQTLLYIPTRRT